MSLPIRSLAMRRVIFLFGVRGSLPAESPLTERAKRCIGVVTASPGVFLRGRDGISHACEIVGYQHDV